MKTSILFFFVISLIVVGCSTTTHFNLTATYPEYLEKELNKVEKETGLGVEVSIMSRDWTEIKGELLCVRDSTIIVCAKYSATEEELAKQTFPILSLSNSEIQKLTIEGSNWIWEGIGIGATVGIMPYILGHSTKTYASQEDSEESAQLYSLLFGLTVAAGWGIGYALSTEEYVLQNVPADYNFSILRNLSRYPNEEPEYLQAIE